MTRHVRKPSQSRADPLVRGWPPGQPFRFSSKTPEPTGLHPFGSPQGHADVSERDLKKGSAELLILSLLDGSQRHGYEISKLIETRSGGCVRFRVASLYPLLYRLEDRGWVSGRLVEKAGQRRRRYYRLTAAGRRILAKRHTGWDAFVEAIRRITGVEYA
jgi:PadR family transcriptional regulator PadR